MADDIWTEAYNEACRDGLRFNAKLVILQTSDITLFENPHHTSNIRFVFSFQSQPRSSLVHWAIFCLSVAETDTSTFEWIRN